MTVKANIAGINMKTIETSENLLKLHSDLLLLMSTCHLVFCGELSHWQSCHIFFLISILAIVFSVVLKYNCLRARAAHIDNILF